MCSRCGFGPFPTLGVTGDPVVGKPGDMTKLPEWGIEVLFERDCQLLAIKRGTKAVEQGMTRLPRRAQVLCQACDGKGTKVVGHGALILSTVSALRGEQT